MCYIWQCVAYGCLHLGQIARIIVACLQMQQYLRMALGKQSSESLTLSLCAFGRRQHYGLVLAFPRDVHLQLSCTRCAPEVHFQGQLNQKRRHFVHFDENLSTEIAIDREILFKGTSLPQPKHQLRCCHTDQLTRGSNPSMMGSSWKSLLCSI